MDAEVTRVLLLSANPKDTDQLRLNEEFREIREGLSLSNNRTLFDIKQGGATRAKDLRRLIFSYNPHIIHFSGHSSSDGIFLESDTGRYNPVTGYALANLFSLFSDTVRCVILNACYSREQAVEIVQHIPYVVGMSTRIRDDSAIQFAIGFYDAIGAGRNIKDSYKFGCNAIQLEGGNSLGGRDRSLILPVSGSADLDKYTDIDEADKPILLTRVKEILADSEKPAADLEPEKIPKQKSTPSPQPVVPNINKPPRNWLPWVLAGLVLIPVLSFVLWDYSKRGLIDYSNVLDNSATEKKASKNQDGLQNLPIEIVAPETVAPKTKVEPVDPEPVTEVKPEAQENKPEKELETTVDSSFEKDAEEKRLAEQAKREAKAEAEANQQRLREEELAKRKAEQEKLDAKERKLKARERALKRAEEERRQAIIRAKELERQVLEKEKAEQAAIAQRQRAEQIRRQKIQEQEEQRKAAAARAAWQARQDEIARQQAEQKRRAQQEAIEAAKQKAAEPKPQTQEQKKESAAERMVREVDELWFQ